MSAKAFFLCNDEIDLFIDDWQVIWVTCFSAQIKNKVRTQNMFDSHEQAHLHAALLT